MGLLFDLVADAALQTEAYESCNVCGRSGVDLYLYQGKLTLDNGEIDDDIYTVCADCIKTKSLTHLCDFAYIQTIEKYLAGLPASVDKLTLKTKLVDQYQKTPDIPGFMQYEDKPLCCETITEFIGHPQNAEQLYSITEKYIYWEKGVKEKSEFYNFRQYGLPESLRDIAAFRCPACNKLYFTFQFM